MLYNPLLERFLKPPEAEQAHRRYNFEVQLGDQEIDGLPTYVNLETICSLEYLKFSCGISQCYAIVNVGLFVSRMPSRAEFRADQIFSPSCDRGLIG